MNSNPFDNSVSVIVATRNSEKYLHESLSSVMISDRLIHEVLVVDGESSDATEKIALSFPKVRFIIQRGKGIAGAYNTGIAIASGNLIAFNSSDDLWAGNKLEKQCATLVEHPGVQIVAGHACNFLDDENFIPPGFRRELLEPHVAFNMEMLLARRSVFELVGQFDESLTTAEDVDWFCRARDLNVQSAVVPEVLLRKRIHASNSHMNPANNHFLLQALHNSVQRKRGSDSTSSAG